MAQCVTPPPHHPCAHTSRHTPGYTPPTNFKSCINPCMMWKGFLSQVRVWLSHHSSTTANNAVAPQPVKYTTHHIAEFSTTHQRKKMCRPISPAGNEVNPVSWLAEDYSLSPQLGTLLPEKETQHPRQRDMHSPQRKLLHTSHAYFLGQTSYNQCHKSNTPAKHIPWMIT